MKRIDGKHLATFRLSAVDFDAFMAKWRGGIFQVDHIEEYFYGFKFCPQPKLNKNYGVSGSYKSTSYAICPERWINPEGCKNDWRQVIVMKSEDQESDILQKDFSGNYCWNYVMNIVKNAYSDAEIEECFINHQEEKNDSLKQLHINYRPNIRIMAIYRLDDCVKYDINGAHCDALCEIFPRCRKEFEKLYEKRKVRPEIKKYFNYAVGMMNTERIGRSKTYNWIVHRTTRMLMKMMNEVGGEIVYANTDGFIARHPEKKPEGSRKLGEFKKEYEGTVYFYEDKNYVLYQMGKDMVGNCRIEVRDRISLPEGKVVHYSMKKSEITLKSGTYDAVTLDNIEEERLTWL